MRYSLFCGICCPSSSERSMSSFLRIFLGLRIHSCSGDMQFHRTQGNHRATPSSTTRKMMSYAFLDIKGTLEIQRWFSTSPIFYLSIYFVINVVSWVIFQTVTWWSPQATPCSIDDNLFSIHTSKFYAFAFYTCSRQSYLSIWCLCVVMPVPKNQTGDHGRSVGVDAIGDPFYRSITSSKDNILFCCGCPPKGLQKQATKWMDRSMDWCYS